jgi:formylglycine-generating enzyme required for sulfatase activity
VRVPDFWLGQFPVTQAQWREVALLQPVKRYLNLEPSYFRSDLLPVERVSWYEAMEFCARLRRLTGKYYRLPTEAEWEFACRALIPPIPIEKGGGYSPFAFGETISTDQVNYNGNYSYGDAPKGEYRKTTTPMGTFEPNAYGLQDMHGNVWEWCADTWHGSYEGKPDECKDSGSIIWSSSDMSWCVVRGGSWNYNPRYCRSAYRFDYFPDYRYFNIGFRVLCEGPRISSPLLF